MIITLDLETKSYADLKKVGPWAYSEDPTTDVICVCWGIGREPIREWWPGEPAPLDLFERIAAGDLVEAHNVAFEYSIWHNVLAPRYGWPLPPLTQFRDTMAVACYYAMPAALDRLARALKYQGKDPEGARLITKYSKLYLKTAKTEIPDEDFFKFVDYCKKDVQIEQSISDELGDLPEREIPHFLLDLEINLRGIYLDADGIAAATAIVDQRAAELELEFAALTAGLKPGQHAKVLQWFAANGLVLENLQAEYLEGLIEEGDIPQGPARRALEIRLAINKASTKKLDAMARNMGKDGRARWQTRYHGAVTGRNTGSGFQPLNLNRGFDDMDPEQLVRDIMLGDAQWLDMIYGDATDAVAKASRYFIKAAPGNKIIAGDFSSIEAVILACLAGEEWKVDAFRRGEKLYERMGESIHGLPLGTVTKETHPSERQDGKTGELAFGYQGALGAWLKFDNSGRHSDEKIIEFCKAWRRRHPEIVNFWWGLNRAAIDAVDHRGSTTGYRGIGFECVDEWLTMILPNGKRLWYREPQLRATMPRYHEPLVNEDCATGRCDCRPSPQVTYLSAKGGTFQRTYTYGGKLAENATQAVSREVLEQAKKRAVAAGYQIILTIYDEIVAEVPKEFGSVGEFRDLMLASPGEWATGWPIDAKVWEGERFRK